MKTANDVHKGRMVVAVDDSPGSIAALEWASKHAHRFNMYIEAVTAWDYQYEVGETMAAGLGGQTYIPGIDPKSVAEHKLAHAINKVFEDARPFDLITKVENGDPVLVLVEESKGAELVVVGSRGHGPLLDLFLGSVSDKTAVKAHCPVVIVHPLDGNHNHD